MQQITPLSTESGGQQPSPVDERRPIRPLTTESADSIHDVDPQAVENSELTHGNSYEAHAARPSGPDALADAPADPPADLARSVLAGVRSHRDPRAGRSSRDRRRAALRRANLSGRNRGGYSGPRPDPERDPARVGDLLDDFVSEQGWQRPLADARVFAEWPLLVGADVAAHCNPHALRDGELRVTAESTAWATQLRLLLPVLHARLVAELGAHVVRRIVVTGPTTPNWRHGPWSVRGARGPRDTYG